MTSRRQPLPNDLTAKAPTFVGLRNVQRPERLPYGALAVAENVDIDDTGTLETRQGYRLATPLDAATDLFCPVHGEFLAVVDDGKLLTVTPDLGITTLATGLQDESFCWAELGDRVFFAGNEDAGTIINGHTLWPLRLPMPPQPAVQVATGGENPAGVYQVRLVYRHLDTYLESPASRSLTVQAPDGAVLLIVSPGLAGYEIDVYVSECNGAVPYFQGTFAVGTFAVSKVSGALDLDSTQRDSQPLPTGITALCCHETSLYAATYSARDDIGFVWLSIPFHHHLFRLGKDYFAVPGKVLGMCSTPQGLLIGTTRNIWLRTPDSAIAELAGYGVVEGRPFAMDKDGTTAIWTQHGPATFPPYKVLTEGKVSVPPGSECTTAILDRHGLKQFIALTDDGGAPFNPY